MKYLILFIVPLLVINLSCRRENGNIINGVINKQEETIEYPIINVNNSIIPDTNKENSKIIYENTDEINIQYISWENIIKFIGYKTFSLLSIDRMTGGETAYNGTYILNIQDNITFLDIYYDNGEYNKWLILANGTLCDIYGLSVGYRISGVTGSVNRTEIVSIFPGIVRSSSYLVEDGISYLPDNLGNNYKMPWAEGVEGLGINEKLYFENGFIDKGSMHISIGYVSYDKPYLYNQNSRPKTIKLSVENKFSIIVDLEDTPHYQEIIFPSSIYHDDILVLEILDVYPGTKYEDTCINTILFEQRRGYYDVNDYWEYHP
jgi:hypothetical protein